MIFFLAIYGLISCITKEKDSAFLIRYEHGTATHIDFKIDDKKANYTVVLKGIKNQAIIGNSELDGYSITFKPIIPFTAGESYEILKDGIVFITFSIKAISENIKPKVLTIYPTTDSVPENLLKMHFVFSKPMQQSEPFLDFIRVINNDTKEVSNPFLPLENELWNKDHTEITLWLDPGRIKQDLIPNKKSGIPIKKGNTYEIVILNNLRDAEGISLGKNYNKTIRVKKRDRKQPSVENWKLNLPKPETKSPLGIYFDEPLDITLVKEMIQVLNDKNELAQGNFVLTEGDKNIFFTPIKNWKRGKYILLIDSKLEDLAGNNLNRLFDTDLQLPHAKNRSISKQIQFVIQ
ncbi:MAG: hypothetical protein GKR88_12080 [Flavobacteriaceae bacterium]|nr:MAG: hypothetical protein GKR88_12080 [Flavobacteriaceae bacterium]